MAKKIVLIKLEIQNGDYRYTDFTLVGTKAKKIGLVALRFARSFYSNFSHSDNDWLFFHGGEVAVRLANYQILTPAEARKANKFFQ